MQQYYKEKCKKYVGDNIEEMPGLLREELFEFYREFGADEAISCKPEYMSYIVQLPDNARLFALNDDRNHEGKSGFSKDCFKWIEDNK